MSQKFTSGPRDEKIQANKKCIDKEKTLFVKQGRHIWKLHFYVLIDVHIFIYFANAETKGIVQRTIHCFT